MSVRFLLRHNRLRALCGPSSFQRLNTARRCLCAATTEKQAELSTTEKQAEPSTSVSTTSAETPSKDYKYFSSLFRTTQDTKEHKLTTIQKHQENTEVTMVTSSASSAEVELYKDIDLSDLKPVLQTESYNLATYVNQSELLSNLVKLGVDLSKVEKDRATARLLLKLDFTNDVQPHLNFLHKIGVSDTDLGQVITKNPGIFREGRDDLQIRVSYLFSKKFSKEAIGRIITKAPKVLSMSTHQVDAHLGFLQKEFQLSGDDIRFVITRWPQLTVCKQEDIKQVKFTLDMFLGFSQLEMKQLLLNLPKLYDTSTKGIASRFDYLHNQMGLTHQQIVQWPGILRTRLHIIKSRHLFLQHLGRAQYDSELENYVSNKAFVSGSDATFCSNVAGVPVKQFNDFLKTL